VTVEEGAAALKAVLATFRQEEFVRHHCIASQVCAAANGATVAPATNSAAVAPVQIHETFG
jgi:hypothetical protein